MERIVLIGMPGAGKTTVGRRIALARGVPLLDTDRLMEVRRYHSWFDGCRKIFLIYLENPVPVVGQQDDGIVQRDDAAAGGPLSPALPAGLAPSAFIPPTDHGHALT